MIASSSTTILRGALLSALVFAASDVNAQVVITNASIAAGGITPGDTPGFPATISASGSYKLGESINVPNAHTATDGILITANDVVIDMNGFSIAGTRVCTPGTPIGNSCVGLSPLSISLIDSEGARVTIKNGNVVGSLGDGISLGDHNLVQNVNVSNSTGRGLVFSGINQLGASIIDSSADLNGGFGIENPSSNDGSLRNVNASYNGAGIDFSKGVIADVRASFNDGDGIRAGNVVIDHVGAFSNAGNGVNGGNSVSNSTARGNSLSGFFSIGGLYIADYATGNTGSGFDLGLSPTCYSNIWSSFNTGAAIVGGTALTGTHVSCP